MKKIILFVLAAAMLAACETEPPVQGVTSGDFTYAGVKHSLAYGEMYYFGAAFPGNDQAGSVNVDMVLVTTKMDYALAFQMHVPRGGAKLLQGTYVMDSENYEAFSITSCKLMPGGAEEDEYIEITEAEVKMEYYDKDDVYFIRFECMVGNRELTGKFNGTLRWFDATEK